MNELGQARMHLKRCQSVLGDIRRAPAHEDETYQCARLEAAHDSFLAALSWVWDAQQRAKEQASREEAAAFFQGLGFDPAKVLLEHPDNAADTWSAVGLVKELKVLGVA